MLLESKNIKKGFFNKKVLDGFDLVLEEGYIYGLVGPNGSGKSTFMKIVAGLVQKNSGELLFKGNVFNNKTRYAIAYQPTEDYFYNWMKVKDTINFYKDFYKDFDYNKALEFVKDMELDIDQKVSGLSTGQKGRLKILLILSRKASLYMLDEPLNGIDPVSRDKIIEIISKEIDGSKTIIISSHLIKEFETILDRVIFLKEGKVFLDEDCEELRLSKSMSVHDYYKTIYN